MLGKPKYPLSKVSLEAILEKLNEKVKRTRS